VIYVVSLPSCIQHLITFIRWIYVQYNTLMNCCL